MLFWYCSRVFSMGLFSYSYRIQNNHQITARLTFCECWRWNPHTEWVISNMIAYDVFPINKFSRIDALMNLAAIFFQANAAQMNCPADQFMHKGTCCRRCPIGHQVSRACIPGRHEVTECTACVLGSTYESTSRETGAQECLPCTVCPKYSRTMHECNTTHDTVCECDSGYRYDVTERRCLPCRHCDAGYGVVSVCSYHSDTECERCPNGTFVEEPSLNASCRPCSHCTEDQIMLQACIPTQDSICLGIRRLSLYNKRKAIAFKLIISFSIINITHRPVLFST